MTGHLDELITVSCPHHRDRLIEGLWNRVTARYGLDVEWRWGGQSVGGHRLVLDMFLSPETLSDIGRDSASEPQSPVDIFHSSGDRPHLIADHDNLNLQSVLQFLYTGQTDVPRSELEHLLIVAEQCSLQFLVDAVQAAKNGRVVSDVTTTSEPAAESCRMTCRRRPPPSDGCAMASSDSEDRDGHGGSGNEEWRPASSSGKSGRRRRKPKIAVTERRMVAGVRKQTRRNVAVMKTVHGSDVGVDDVKGEVVVPKPDGVVPDGNVAVAVVSPRRRTVAQSTSKTHACPHCEFSTGKSWRYYGHLRSAHGVNSRGEPAERREHPCGECDFVAKSKCELRYHAVAKHSPEGKPFKCGECGIGFGRKADMKKHVQVSHLGIRAHLCEHCGHRAVSKTKLMHHYRVHTGEKPYRCEQCNKAYADRTTYRRHLQAHKPDRAFICHECGRAFGRQDNLNTHLKKGHQKSHRQFSCRLCAYTSGMKRDLTQHLLREHTDIKPFACSACDFRTGTAQNLDRHRRMHTKEKPFSCKMCTASYGDRTTFRRHVQRHLSDDKPHVCPICNHAFSVRYSLNAHLKNVHKHVQARAVIAEAVCHMEVDVASLVQGLDGDQ